MNRIVFCLVLVALVIGNFWLVRSLYDLLFRPQYVIAPFRITGDKAAEAKLGESFASMLQGRLVQILRDLENSQRFLREKPSPEETEDPPGAAAGAPPSVRDTRTSWVSPLPLPLVEMRTNLFQTLDINVTVSGVPVGGLFAWMHQRWASPRTVQFSVYTKGDKATISGDLRLLSGPKEDSLWLETGSDPLEITESIAYALIRKKISEAQTEDIEALDVNEVRTLLTTLFKVADYNRKVELGRPPGDEIPKLFPAIDQLAQKAPEWPALVFFAASMAESAGQNERALHYYGELKRLAKDPQAGPIPVDVATIDKKIAKLTPAANTARDLREQKFINATKEYAERLTLPGPDPAIIFRAMEMPGQYTLWNAEDKRYEVNTQYIETSGLPEYVALMGRFMLKHYDRCFGQKSPSASTVEIWNDFRYSLTSYLLSTEPTVSKSGDTVANFDEQLAQSWIARILKKLETTLGDPEPVRQLVLILLDRYQCDWSRENLREKVLAINQELKLMPDQLIGEAFAAEGLGARPAPR